MREEAIALLVSLALVANCVGLQVNMVYQYGSMLSMIDKHMDLFPSEFLEPFSILALHCCRDETDACPRQRTKIDIFMDNPYISYDISGSKILSGNIPGVAPC